MVVIALRIFVLIGKHVAKRREISQRLGKKVFGGMIN